MLLHTGCVVFMLSLLFLIHSNELQIECHNRTELVGDATGFEYQDHQEGISGHLNNATTAIYG